jgi:hypothetical protein
MAKLLSASRSRPRKRRRLMLEIVGSPDPERTARELAAGED